jgi:regulator of sigma E protease
MYIIIAIVAFGILITVHELGHVLAAKAFHVKVNEFAIGMGPALLKRQRGETLYTLRALPIGGYCAMEGEDEESPDARAFTRQTRWKRLIILAAGSFMNFLTGFLIVIFLFISAESFGGTTITALADGFPNEGENGLMAGDTIISVDGERLYYSGDFITFMARSTDGEVDLVILRDGEKIVLDNFPLEQREYVDDGETVLRYGVTFNVIPATAWEKLKYSTYTALNFVRLTWVSLGDLIRGTVGFNDLSGPVGIVSAINQIGNESSSASAAASNIAYICAFIAANLAVMNLLPIPAVDGSFILFFTYEAIKGSPINQKVLEKIQFVGIALLIILGVFVIFNDLSFFPFFQKLFQ